MSSPAKPLFTRRTSTVTTIESDDEHDENYNHQNTLQSLSSSWRPPSLSTEYHSWKPDNVARIIAERHLDSKQQGKLQAFRQATRHIEHWKNGPYTALQFLREWRWKVPAAVAAFERMIAWREKNGVDGIADASGSSDNYFAPHPDYNYFPQAILQGTDRQGNPIYVERTGATHLWDLLHRHGNDETVRASTWIREKCTTGEWVAQWEAQSGRGLSGTTAIVDLSGLCRKHASWHIMQAVKNGTQIIQANWPCEANRVIIIRAPALFRYVWSFLKPFLTETVKEMITICTSADPLSELDEFVDLDVLPPCINPNGHGDAWPEFGPIVWEGGPLPSESSTKIVGQTSLASPSPSSRTSPSKLTSPRKEKARGTSPKTVISLGVGGF